MFISLKSSYDLLKTFRKSGRYILVITLRKLTVTALLAAHSLCSNNQSNVDVRGINSIYASNIRVRKLRHNAGLSYSNKLIIKT